MWVDITRTHYGRTDGVKRCVCHSVSAEEDSKNCSGRLTGSQ